MAGQIYVFSGPSGVGKSTILQTVRRDVGGLSYSISHTSRAPRGREQNGTDYHFVSPQQFEEMIRNQEFAEWARVYRDFYGTSWNSLRKVLDQGLDVIMDVDIQGGRNIKKQYPSGVLVFVLPPSLEVLETRLRARATDAEKIIRSRIGQAREEIRNCVFYDYLIINDRLEEATAEACSIVRAERCRREARWPQIKERFGL